MLRGFAADSAKSAALEVFVSLISFPLQHVFSGTSPYRSRRYANKGNKHINTFTIFKAYYCRYCSRSQNLPVFLG